MLRINYQSYFIYTANSLMVLDLFVARCQYVMIARNCSDSYIVRKCQTQGWGESEFEFMSVNEVK